MHVFLTGAAGGIGRHVAETFVGRPHVRVTASDVTEERLVALVERVAARGDQAERLAARGLDVTDAAAWEAALDAAQDRFGPVDVLINNAGYLDPDWLTRASDGAVDRHVDVNIKGVMHGSRAAARRMSARGAGHIINMGSLSALSPVPGLSLYAATKWAVRGFSLSIAQELAPAGVAVTVIHPDAVRTPMLELQRGRAEAALTFSGSRSLTPAEVMAALDRAVKARPRELAIPWRRGLLARAAGLAPGLAGRLEPLLRRRGRNNQQR